MRIVLWTGFLLSLLIAPALAQNGVFGTLSWGPTGIPGLQYTVACNAFAGPSWTYHFRNETASAIAFSYSFAGSDENYSHTVAPHGTWVLRQTAPRSSCRTEGPLRIAPRSP